MKTAPRLLRLSAATLISIACVDGSDLSGGGGEGGDDGSSSSDSTGAGHAGNTGAGAAGPSSTGSNTTSGPTGCDDPSTPCFDQSCVDAGMPFIDPTLLGAPCGEEICGADALGRCLDAGLVPAGQADLLATCADGTSLCVPDRLIATNGNPEPIVCNSIAGAEGRCVSRCIPDVKAQEEAAGLPQDICTPGDVCVPCYSPLDGSETGVCSLGAPGCDAPVEPPTQFANCCDDKGGGKCIPVSILGPSSEQLGQDSCIDGSKCVPSVLYNAQMSGQTSYLAPSCTTGGFIGGGEPGACLPKCIPDADSFLLSQGDCNNDYENCAPCDTPIIGGATGACDPIVF